MDFVASENPFAALRKAAAFALGLRKQDVIERISAGVPGAAGLRVQVTADASTNALRDNDVLTVFVRSDDAGQSTNDNETEARLEEQALRNVTEWAVKQARLLGAFHAAGESVLNCSSYRDPQLLGSGANALVFRAECRAEPVKRSISGELVAGATRPATESNDASLVVALKVIRNYGWSSNSIRLRFRNEHEILSDLQHPQPHPNIVTLYATFVF
jgi:hypothetical protein